MTISILQQASFDGSGTSNSQAFSFTSNTTAGSIIAAFGFANFTTITGMSSAQNGALTQAVEVTGDSGNRPCYGFYVPNIVGGTMDTITATYNASTAEHPLVMVEIGGAATSSVLTGTATGADQTSPGTGAGAVSPGSITPTANPGLAVAISMCLGNNQGTFTATSPFTAQTKVWGGTSGGSALISSYRFTSNSALTPTFSIGTNSECVSLVLAFLELVSGSLPVGGIIT